MPVSKKQKLVSDIPLLLEEWDWTKNQISPYETSFGSAKKAFWLCSICGYSWDTPVYSRGSNGSGCPMCARKARGETKRISSAKRNGLLEKFPEIAREWHPQKNSMYSIDEVSAYSNIKVWWLCGSCGYEWETAVNHRTKEGNGCPVCARIMRGQKYSNAAAIRNGLDAANPELAAEWHPYNNGELLPCDVSAQSNRRVWWLCSFCGAEWQDTVNHRSSGRGCPQCSKAQTSFAEQVVYYYVAQVFPDAVNRYIDEFEFDIYIPSQRIAIEYDGKFFHGGDDKLENDNRKDAYCKLQGIKLFRFRSPDLQDTQSAIRITCEHHQTEKGIREFFDIIGYTCPKIDIDADRVRIVQKFRQIQKVNSILSLFPEIAGEWHPTKNGNLKPNAVMPKSNIKFWWLCKNCNYEWMATPSHRCGRGDGCPLCGGRVLVQGVNDFQTIYPEMALEWNYERNGGLLPSAISQRSNRKIWWKCIPYGHEWEARINDRTKTGHNTGCPYCANKKVMGGFNDLCTTHPRLSQEWDYAKNGELRPEQITYGSSKKVWWICSKCGHNWHAIIYSRSRGNGCPACRKNKTK